MKYYHSTSAERFEEAGKARKKYDPAMFPLYDGYKPGTENTEVYEEGGITVWKTVMPYFIAAACLLLIGGFFYARLFRGPLQEAGPGSAHLRGVNGEGLAGIGSGKPGASAREREAEAPGHAARTGLYLEPDRPGTATAGRFRTRYGLRLEWGEGKTKQTIIVTAWPLDQPDRYSRQDIDNIRSAGPVLSQAIPSSGNVRPVTAAPSHPRATAYAYVPPTMGAWNPDPFGSK